MTQNHRGPLILVVDDVPEFREDLLPSLAKSLGCRSIGAGTVHEAIQIAAEHGSASADPIKLAIIDMHMPYDEKSMAALDSGTRCLEAITQLKHLRLLDFPCVVFTAYPSFHDCVAATKAGAVAYVPKVRHDNEGGPDALRRICERLLRKDEPTAEAPPTRDWIEKHHEWLASNFNGKWVAFVPAEQVQNEEIQCEPSRDGVVLLAGNSYEEVRARVVKYPCVLRTQPSILMVRGKRSAPDHAKE